MWWVLVIFFSTGQSGATAQIEFQGTQQEQRCIAARDQMLSKQYVRVAHCVQK